MAKKKKRAKRRNVIAKDLRTPKYRMRVVQSKKRYKRNTLKTEGNHLNDA